MSCFVDFEHLLRISFKKYEVHQSGGFGEIRTSNRKFSSSTLRWQRDDFPQTSTSEIRFVSFQVIFKKRVDELLNSPSTPNRFYYLALLPAIKKEGNETPIMYKVYLA